MVPLMMNVSQNQKEEEGVGITVQYLKEKEEALREMKAKELEFMGKKHNDSVEMQRTMIQSMLNQQQAQQQQVQDMQWSFL